MGSFTNSLENAARFFRYLPALIWSFIAGAFQWFVPRCWYAKKVDQDIILITGAGSGLGRAISLEYAKLNAQLILWDINQSGLDETRQLVMQAYSANNKEEEAARSCSTYIVDVSDKERVSAGAQQVFDDLNRGRPQDEPEKYVTVLVNNAGIYHGLTLQELKDEQIERIFKINILSHFWTVRAFLPNMIKHEKGHIVEIASMGGIAGMLKQVDYCATKYATVGFEESLSIELDFMGYRNKIYTTAVCPLFFQSNLFTGYNTNAAQLMNVEYVAREAVLTMRCNQSRVLLPQFRAYLLWIIKPFMTRSSVILLTRALGFDEGIKDIRGAAL